MDKRKDTMNSEKQNKGPSESKSPDKGDPLSEVKMDIQALMKKCSELNHELRESQHKWESNIKKILLVFLEAVDGFERLFGNIEPKLDSADRQTKIWINNFRTVYKLLLQALKAADVTSIETISGEMADPKLHNVVEIVENPELRDNTIVEEIKKGYLLQGKLLRAAEVKVVRNE